MRFLRPVEPGIYTPASYKGLIRDGDTPLFELPIFGRVALRLSNIDTPERGEPGYEKAAALADELLRGAHEDYELQVMLELPSDVDGDGRVTLVELLKKSTWDRWPGTAFCGQHDLREMLIERGLAVWKEYKKR